MDKTPRATPPTAPVPVAQTLRRCMAKQGLFCAQLCLPAEDASAFSPTNVRPHSFIPPPVGHSHSPSSPPPPLLNRHISIAKRARIATKSLLPPPPPPYLPPPSCPLPCHENETALLYLVGDPHVLRGAPPPLEASLNRPFHSKIVVIPDWERLALHLQLVEAGQLELAVVDVLRYGAVHRRLLASEHVQVLLHWCFISFRANVKYMNQNP